MQLMTVGCGCEAGTEPVKKPASKTKAAAAVAVAEESNSDDEEVEATEQPIEPPKRATRGMI